MRVHVSRFSLLFPVFMSLVFGDYFLKNMWRSSLSYLTSRPKTKLYGVAAFIFSAALSPIVIANERLSEKPIGLWGRSKYTDIAFRLSS